MKFKNLLTKTLLVAAGLCVGASAWATITVSDGTTVSSLEYTKYEFLAYEGNAYRAMFRAGGNWSKSGSLGGSSDSRGWFINAVNRYISITLNTAIAAGDVITVNCASETTTENGVAICTSAVSDFSNDENKIVYIKFPSTHTTTDNYDLSYTAKADDGIVGQTTLYFGLPVSANRKLYIKDIKVTTSSAAAAVAPQQLTDEKTWTFASATTGSITSNQIYDNLYIGASAEKSVEIVESSKTISNVAYTKALKLTNNSGMTNPIGDAEATSNQGCIMFRLPEGSGSFSLVTECVGTGGYVYYCFAKTTGSSRTRFSLYTNQATTNTFNYSASDPRVVYFYTGGPVCNLYSVIIKRFETATIGTTGWTTFSSSYPLDLSNMSANTGDVTAFYASAVGGENVTMTSTASTGVAAGEGLMLKGTAGATITIPVVATGDAISVNKLVGCTTATDLTTPNANYYVLVNNGGKAEFQNLSGSYTDNKVTIPAGKAYLNAAGAGARALKIVFDDEATGISDELRVKSEESANAVYNMQGQRVASPKKGLYIVNGKKVMMK